VQQGSGGDELRIRRYLKSVGEDDREQPGPHDMVVEKRFGRGSGEIHGITNQLRIDNFNTRILHDLSPLGTC